MATVGTKAETKAKSVIWKYGDGITPEVDFLIQRNKLKLGLDTFSLKSAKGWKTYPVTYYIHFHSIETDKVGAVKKLLFIVFESEEAKKADLVLKMDYLRKNYGLIVDSDSDNAYYSFKMDGKWYHYGRDAEFEFYDVRRDAAEITSLKFNVVLKCEKIWTAEQGTETPEFKYLMKEKNLVVDPDNFKEMYRYERKNGEIVAYPSGSRIVFHNIKLDQHGEIVSASFQFQRLVWR